MTETVKPSLGLAFEPLDAAPAPVPEAPAVREQQAAVRRAAKTLSAVNGAPPETKKTEPKKRPGKPRRAPEAEAEASKPEWRRRPGRPRSSRRHALTLKSTERHLRFLYALTEVEDGLLVDAVEDGLVALAREVLVTDEWRGHALSDEARALAEELAG